MWNGLMGLPSFFYFKLKTCILYILLCIESIGHSHKALVPPCPLSPLSSITWHRWSESADSLPKCVIKHVQSIRWGCLKKLTSSHSCADDVGCALWCTWTVFLAQVTDLCPREHRFKLLFFAPLTTYPPLSFSFLQQKWCLFIKLVGRIQANLNSTFCCSLFAVWAMWSVY